MYVEFKKTHFKKLGHHITNSRIRGEPFWGNLHVLEKTIWGYLHANLMKMMPSGGISICSFVKNTVTASTLFAYFGASKVGQDAFFGANQLGQFA
jgi:hypothetical protein